MTIDGPAILEEIGSALKGHRVGELDSGGLYVDFGAFSFSRLDASSAVARERSRSIS